MTVFRFQGYTATYYTHHYLTDSSVNYATHYSADTVTDSIMYHTFFYSSLSDNPLYDTSLYYNFHYRNTSIYDSAKNNTVVHTIGAITDSTIYTTVYNTIDSVADTTLYFTESFKTVYSAESWQFVPESRPAFNWVYLFPPMIPQDPDTSGGGGGGFGMVLPHSLTSSIDTTVIITIAPNPFSGVLHVNFTNMGNNEHDGMLQVVNSVGQEVQSLPVQIIPQCVGEFDIDLSKHRPVSCHFITVYIYICG